MTPAALFSKGFLPINGPVGELLFCIGGWAVISGAVAAVAKVAAVSGTLNTLCLRSVVGGSNHDG